MSGMHETRIDIPVEVRDKVVGVLNQELADLLDAYTQAKQAHWNVKGSDFFQLHELFDQVAASVLPHIDLVAERVTTLGGTARGTARMSASSSRLPEYPEDAVRGEEHVRALIDRFAVLAKNARIAIDVTAELDDQDTSDILIEISRDLDKELWFLEAHIQS